MRIIQLTLDLTDAPRRLAHVVADLPVRPNTTASFTTPLWFCATHMPSGPVGRISGLFFTTDNDHTVLKWRRDATRTHIYHVDVPSGVTTVRASFDAILGRHLTRRMAMALWEAFMLHPAYSPVSSIPVQATIRIPGNWDYATSLVTESEEAANDGAYKTIIFKPVSAERLEDSPVLIRQYLSQSDITKDGKHQLCVAFSAKRTRVAVDKHARVARHEEKLTVIFCCTVACKVGTGLSTQKRAYYVMMMPKTLKGDIAITTG